MARNDVKTPKTFDVEVRAASIQTRDGINAKKGDVISIPVEESQQSPSVRYALRSGNLRAVRVQTDLAPVKSEPVKPVADGTDVKTLDDQ